MKKEPLGNKDPSPLLKNDDLCAEVRGLSDFFKKEDFSPFSRAGSNDFMLGMKNDIIQSSHQGASLGADLQKSMYANDSQKSFFAFSKSHLSPRGTPQQFQVPQT